MELSNQHEEYEFKPIKELCFIYNETISQRSAIEVKEIERNLINYRLLEEMELLYENIHL